MAEVPEKVEATAETVEQQAEDTSDIARIEALVDRKLGQFQGKIAGVFGERIKKVNEDIDSRLEQVLTRREQAQLARQQYIAELQRQGLDEDQVRAVLDLQAKQQAAAQPKQEKPAESKEEASDDGYGWTLEERRLLGRSVGALLDGMNIDGVEVTDQRLWAGARHGMTTEEAYEVAKKNARALSAQIKSRPTGQSTTTQPTSQPKSSTPVSTQGATASISSTYATKAEAASAFARGEINSAQYVQALGNLGR